MAEQREHTSPAVHVRALKLWPSGPPLVALQRVHVAAFVHVALA